MKIAETFRPTWTGAGNLPASIPEGCFAVTTYCIERCYGGPEEGGWWYDWWTPGCVMLCATLDDATAQMDAQRQLDEAATEDAKQDEAAYNDACLRQANRLGVDPDSIGSLNYGSRFVTMVEEPTDYLGRASTGDRPHYE